METRTPKPDPVIDPTSTIDRDKPVLVTGANGYVASWLVKRLLDVGLRVHCAVRDISNEAKISHLRALPGAERLEFFEADLLEEGSYLAAMQGCSVVFHTASPFNMYPENPKRDLIDPAVRGSANVLRSVDKTESVERVVLTSSVAAIYTDSKETQGHIDGLDESHWNETASMSYQPYHYSKTLAEKKAWEIAGEQNRWDLVVINMSLVFGPAMNVAQNTSESMNIMQMFGDGQLRFGAPDLGFGIVDVRDVAEAHLRAAFISEAKGRYITSAYTTSIMEIAEVLRDKYSDYPLPKWALPKWPLVALGPLLNKTFNRKFLANNLNIGVRLDSSKIVRDLAMSYRSPRETIEDTFQSLIDGDIFKK